MQKQQLHKAFIKYNKGLVVYISGLSGCGKSDLAKNLSRELSLDLIEQVDYFKEDYNDKITLPDNTEHVNRYTDDAFDWVRLNKDIKDKKKTGVIVYGYALVGDKLKIKPDFHIHLSISKQVCLDRKREYLEKHKEEYKEEYEKRDDPTEKLKMNKMIFPYYLDTKSRSSIDKYINTTEMKGDEVLDDVWKTLFEDVITQGKVEDLYWKFKSGKEGKEDKKGEKNDVNNSESTRSITVENMDTTPDEADTENMDLDDDDKITDGPIDFGEEKFEMVLE